MWEVLTAALEQAQLVVWAARAACSLLPEGRGPQITAGGTVPRASALHGPVLSHTQDGFTGSVCVVLGCKVGKQTQSPRVRLRAAIHPL